MPYCHQDHTRLCDEQLCLIGKWKADSFAARQGGKIQVHMGFRYPLTTERSNLNSIASCVLRLLHPQGMEIFASISPSLELLLQPFML
jgi:hypothetical protein